VQEEKEMAGAGGGEGHALFYLSHMCISRFVWFPLVSGAHYDMQGGNNRLSYHWYNVKTSKRRRRRGWGGSRGGGGIIPSTIPCGKTKVRLGFFW